MVQCHCQMRLAQPTGDRPPLHRPDAGLLVGDIGRGVTQEYPSEHLDNCIARWRTQVVSASLQIDLSLQSLQRKPYANRDIHPPLGF